MIVAPTADLGLAVRAIVFAAVGTCGQRCTSLRRIIAHRDIAEKLKGCSGQGLRYTIDWRSNRRRNSCWPTREYSTGFEKMQTSIRSAVSQGGELLCGGNRITEDVPTGGFYVEPALVMMPDSDRSNA